MLKKIAMKIPKIAWGIHTAPLASMGDKPFLKTSIIVKTHVPHGWGYDTC